MSPVIATLVSLLPLVVVEATAIARIGVLGLLLSARGRPVARGLALVAGTFVCYMMLGLLFVFGLGQAVEKAGKSFGDRIENPESIDYVISLVLGVILIYAALRLNRRKATKSKALAVESDVAGESASKGGIGKTFLVGFSMNLVVGPNTLCSFAAYNQILKADFDGLTTLFFIVGYNLVIVWPLVLLIQISVRNRDRASRIFDGMRENSAKWGARLGPPILLAIAVVIIADSIGFFLGHPLIPTGTPAVR